MHVHILFRDGVFGEGSDGALTFRWVKAPTGAELSAPAQHIAERVGRFVERQVLLERDAESPCLSEIALEEKPMEALRAHSITYRIAVGPHSGLTFRTSADAFGANFLRRRRSAGDQALTR